MLEHRERADWHTAKICDTIMKSQGSKKSKVEDHLLTFKNPKKKKQTPKTLEESKSMWFAITGFTPES